MAESHKSLSGGFMLYRVHRHEVTQPSDSSYRLIPLTQGQNALIDAEDFDFISRWNWCLAKRKYTNYAVRREGPRLVSMHEALMQSPYTDHRNGNGLDNRRNNLRKSTVAENGHNRGKSKNNKSGYKGVSWCEPMKRWRARIMNERNEFLLGYFDTREEAAHAYDEKAKELHGAFARLNFR
jgi:hypothetical protein